MYKGRSVSDSEREAQAELCKALVHCMLTIRRDNFRLLQGQGRQGSKAGKSSTYFIRGDQNTWIVYLSDTKNGGGCCADDLWVQHEEGKPQGEGASWYKPRWCTGNTLGSEDCFWPTQQTDFETDSWSQTKRKHRFSKSNMMWDRWRLHPWGPSQCGVFLCSARSVYKKKCILFQLSSFGNIYI